MLVPRHGQVGPLSAREVAEVRLEIGPRARKSENGGAVAGVLGHQSGRHIFSLGARNIIDVSYRLSDGAERGRERRGFSTKVQRTFHECVFRRPRGQELSRFEAELEVGLLGLKLSGDRLVNVVTTSVIATSITFFLAHRHRQLHAVHLRKVPPRRFRRLYPSSRTNPCVLKHRRKNLVLLEISLEK